MTGRRPDSSFDHPALLYRSAEEYLAGTTTFVRSAVAEESPVLVAVPGPNLGALREALLGVADRVVFADMAVAGRNPGRIIPRVLSKFAGDHPGRRVAIIGEPIWHGRTDLEYPACAAHEAMINAVFAGRDAAILCPYDAGRLHRSVIEDAWRTHPTMIEFGAIRASDRYADPFETASSFNQALPAPPADAETLSYGEHSSLAAVRAFVRRHAAEYLSADATEELVLAANELAANTIEHTPGRGRITVWSEPGMLVCQVEDAGLLTDPLAGRMLPGRDRQGGYGLILTHDLCDLVRVHSCPTGTTIRLHKHC
ncbi:sensor histidine kinase [Actinoplanes sp. NPDC049548]|uniref:sensor histidine kinase n=1 Tax=Actinoplanes sp. NPDC049548 TaxID=3155152 RepID=UPI003446BEA3